MNQELADVRAVFRKGIRARDEIANIRWIKEKAKELGIKKKIISAPLTTLKALTVWLPTNCGQLLERW